MEQNRAVPELGAFVSLDHVNLTVPDHARATAFFIDALGLTRDPFRNVGTRNMWVNIGTHQIHLPLGKPTRFGGEIGLVMPDLAGARSALDKLTATPFGEGVTRRDENGSLAVTGPWGMRLRLFAAGTLPSVYPLALAYVTCDVPKGAAAGIAAFYEQVTLCPVERGASQAIVRVGPDQELRFVEHDAPDLGDQTVHVAVYLTRYNEIYARLKALGVVKEADNGRQFRIDRIVHPQTGAPLYVLEHEMRNLYHPDYRRSLVNRALRLD